jgi:hypothetical protein
MAQPAASANLNVFVTGLVIPEYVAAAALPAILEIIDVFAFWAASRPI